MKTESTRKYKVIGQMSGTSLDGLDLAAIEFVYTSGNWTFKIQDAKTISYPENWTKALENAHKLGGADLFKLHTAYAKFIAGQINCFKKDFNPELISIHGHTIFHQPENGFTFQLGDGNVVAAETGITTIADFRQPDVALGGQGAPLVPVGDRLLFAGYDYCLNIGGFANISYEKDGSRIAFDLCPANFILNILAQKQGLAFDFDGQLGRTGQINPELLSNLNSLGFYSQKPPKSLGREWFEKYFLPVTEDFTYNESDKIRTVYEHIALQISNAFINPGEVLVTGGGAFNKFLISKISEYSKVKLIIAENSIINFKEALIFGLLGVLKIRNEVNCLASVTGAIHDHSTGVIYNP